MVEAAEAGKRADRVLTARGLGPSRTAIQRWILEGRVSIHGIPVTADQKLRMGEEVCLTPGPPPSTRAVPEPLDLDIRYQDEDLLVVNKAAGMVVHPAPGHARGTLVNAVLHHAPQVELMSDAGLESDGASGETRYPRPGIVHRLDKDTSGLMVVALSEPAKVALVGAFQRRDIERCYLAIAAGSVSNRRLDAPIERHPRDRKRFSSTTGRGKSAVTHVEPVERLRGATLVRCRLETGRTHQIRVHLADAGHPLLGDPGYGRQHRDPEIAAIGAALGRQALHAGLLGFMHPRTGEPLRFESDLPADFQHGLDQLRGLSS